MKVTEKMKEGEALYIKMLPEGNVGVKFFDGTKWTIGRIFTCPWHKIMGFFNGLDDIKDFTIVEDENTTLKRFNKEVDGIENIYNEVTKLLKSAESSAHYSPRYYNEDVFEDRKEGRYKAEVLKKVVEIIEKEFPNLKEMKSIENN